MILGKDYTSEQRRQLFDYVDVNKDGRIQLAEFRDAFRIGDSAVKAWQGDVMDQLCTFLYQYKDYV
jgi:hypothetical protein